MSGHSSKRSNSPLPKTYRNRSRSRSPSKRSKSRSPSKRSKSRSPSRRSRSRSPSRRSRSRSPSRRSRSRSPSRRSRYRSPPRRFDHSRRHSFRKDFQIKTEEDFDRRQNRAREERLRRERGGRYRHEVKQEVKEEWKRYDDKRQRNWNQHRSNRQIDEAAFLKKEDPIEKEKPNFGLSGALTEDTNTFKGVVIKYNEPPEARIPKRKWRLYPFKGEEALKILHLHRQSAYLLGRLRRIADIAIDHPSCSKQHAVFQFRVIEKDVDGVMKRVIRPYIIDLNSGNGTFVNGEKIQPQRFVELKERDVIKFGLSTRDYVLLHDKSDTSEVVAEDDDEDVESK